MSNDQDKDKTQEETNPSLGGIIEGYDPLYVSFVDETQVRSYLTSAWELDFGDGLFYGLTEDERKAFKDRAATATDGRVVVTDEDRNQYSPYTVFMLPGDREFFTSGAIGAEKWLDEQNFMQFSFTSIMNPKKQEGDLPSGTYITYPQGVNGNSATSTKNGKRGDSHVTSYNFVSGGTTDFGYTNKGQFFVSKSNPDEKKDLWEYDEIFKRPVFGARIEPMNTHIDDCDRGEFCLTNPDENTTVGHLYKGPGVYTSVFKMRSESPVATYGQILSSNNFSEKSREWVVNTVIVHPVCPCLDIGIYNKYDENGNQILRPIKGPDGQYVIEDGKYVLSAIMNAALSSTDYSADNPEWYGSAHEMIDFNPKIFKMYDDEMNVIFEGISGYAPFVMGTTMAICKPNSFPVSAAEFYYDDWYTDMPEYPPRMEFTEFKHGWPLWQPKDDTLWNDETKRIEFFDTHTYIMPGLYSVRAKAEFAYGRIPTYWWDEIDANCNMDTGKKYVVLVKEIMPKNPTVSGSEPSSVGGSVFMDFKFDVTAGSFPICNVVWDFNDGTELLKLTRNTDDGYAPSSIIIDRTTAIYVGSGDHISFDNKSNQYGALDASAGSAYESSGVSGRFHAGIYPEFDPRDWVITHEFQRSALTDKDHFVVSANAYVCNTETRVYGTYEVFPDDVPMPDFKDAEGDVRLIDTRLYAQDNDIVLTLEGKNKRETNLYNVEWEKKEEK